MYRKVLRRRPKHFQCVALTCLMFIFSQSWSWIFLLSTMFTLENLSWKPFEYTTWRICMDYFVTCNVSQCWHTCLIMISHVHMITFTYMVYAYIYIYMYLYIHDRTFVIYERIPYTYINSPCTYDLVFHRLAFSLYTLHFYVRESASGSWVSTCKHGCNLITTPKVHRAKYPHQN